MNKMKTLTLQGVTFEVVDEQARASIPEKIVQAINGIEPDENGNVTIEISGGVSPEEVTTIVKEQFPGGVGYSEVQTVNEPLNITWDGNTDGLVSAGGIAYKVSDLLLTNEQIALVTVYGSDGSAYGASGNTQAADDLAIVGYSVSAIVVRKENVELEGFIFPEKGLYFMNMDGVYVTALTTTEPIEHTKVVTKPIDIKYLPGVFRVNLTIDGDTTYADKTYDEIYAAYKNKMVVEAVRCDGPIGEEYIEVFPLSTIDRATREIRFVNSVVSDGGVTLSAYTMLEDGSATYSMYDIATQ